MKKYVSRIMMGETVIFGVTSMILFLFIRNELSYYEMALISVLQLIIIVLALTVICKYRIMSVPIFFIFFTWFFHCGQIVKLGFNIEGTVPLDFTIYASKSEQIAVFRFYFLAQMLVAIGMMYFCMNRKCIKKTSRWNFNINMKKSFYMMLLIGVIPRIWIDFSGLIGGFHSGYSGVYTLYIPQPMQTLAFFFDTAMIIGLFWGGKSNKGQLLFWAILIYKCLMMLTGARQEKVVFLVIWIYVYYFIVEKIKFRNIITILILLITGIFLVYAIGNTRNDAIFSFKAIWNDFINESKSTLLGDLLGEFGSALCTLEIPFNQIPEVRTWGYGKSYLAGVLSIVPFLVSNIPFLNGETAFVTLFHGTTFFGGSYLGEAFYNFSWVGLFICLFLGSFVSYSQKYMFEKTENNEKTARSIMAVLLSILLILYIRGYFTDIFQKIAWVYIALRIINRSYYKRR